MEECMERLSSRQRAIFKMYKQQERQAEIAKKIEITQAHVADQFNEACIKINRCLQQKGWAPNEVARINGQLFHKVW
jgi:DNA-directed RNA polymerase specialized sigma subunit